MAARETLSEVFAEWFRARRDRDIVRVAHTALGSPRVSALGHLRSYPEAWLWIAASRSRLGHTAVARHACLSVIRSDCEPSETTHARTLLDALASQAGQPDQARVFACPTDWDVAAKRQWLRQCALHAHADPVGLPVVFVTGMSEWRRVILGMPRLALIERDPNDPSDTVARALEDRGLHDCAHLSDPTDWAVWA